MKAKEFKILKFFSSQDDWVTSFSMSTLLHMSVRSIKSHVKDINKQNVDLVQSSQKGFYVSDKKRLLTIISERKEFSVPQSSEERKVYIYRKLVLEEKNIEVEKLADEMFISSITLSKELAKIKTELLGLNLVLKTKRDVIFIEGKERDLKKLISQLIYEDSEHSFFSIELIQKYVPNIDTTHLYTIVSNALQENHYFMDDFSLLNLVLHIAITLERRCHKALQNESLSIEKKKDIDENIILIVDKMIKSIEESYDFKFTNSDIYQITLLVLTRAISNSFNDITIEQLSEFIGNDVLNLLTYMQRKTKEVFNISIINHDFTIRFSLHLKNLLIRLQNNIILRNPQLSEIKNSYPYIYNVSVYLANIVTKKTGYTISEDEISYFALHLGFLIQEKKLIKYEIRVVLVNSQYFLNSSDLERKLTRVFENSLRIVGIVSSLEELDTYSNYDMVISTRYLPTNILIPYIQISGYLSNKDILVISKKIEETFKNRVKSKIEPKLRYLFKKEFFFVEEDIVNKNDLIEKIANTLEFQGHVDSLFKEKLFKREELSSSAFLNIAIPHPFEMCANKSAIAVSIHPSPILWNDNKVNIVFLLAINARDSFFYKDIFDFVTEIISEKKILDTLLKVKNFEEFITTLISYAEN